MNDRDYSGWRLLATAGVLLLLAAAPAAAQTADEHLHIHGFGDWVYGLTDGNQFLSGDHDGNYDDASFGLNLRYDMSDRLAVVGQVEVESEAASGSLTTTLDYAFAQYKINDRLHLRIGRTYLPFGIYSEVRDIGTARPFIERPPEIYGDLAIVSTSLNGLDAYGDLFEASHWGLHYDVYAGATELSVAEPGQLDSHGETVQDIVGVKFTVDTPVNGLKLSAAAFQGKRKEPKEDHRSDGLSLDYLTDRWLLRAEVAEHVEDTEQVRGGYVEGGLRLAGPWQFVARYGVVRETDAGVADSSLLHHRDAAIGINYWLDPRVVLKAEYHIVTGNRLAVPNPAVTGEMVDPDTRAFEAAMQFSF